MILEDGRKIEKCRKNITGYFESSYLIYKWMAFSKTKSGQEVDIYFNDRPAAHH